MSQTMETGSVEIWSGKDRADENFPVGSLLIRRDLRAHVHAFYSFARNADDIADAANLDAAGKLRRLDAMEAVLLGDADAAQSPSAARLRASLAATGVTPRHARDLLIAFRQDATRARYAGWDDLHEYCRYSAMPVGRHVLALHGESEATWPASDALCTSLQVLNHLQDAGRDLASLDRCYLPADLLAQWGGQIADLGQPRLSPGLRRTYDVLLDRCDDLNHAAAALPALVRDRRLRLEVAVIAGLARRLAVRLRREDALAGRVRLRRPDAAGAILGALRFAA